MKPGAVQLVPTDERWIKPHIVVLPSPVTSMVTLEFQNSRTETTLPSFEPAGVQVVGHIPHPVRAYERHLGDRGDVRALRGEDRAGHVHSWRA